MKKIFPVFMILLAACSTPQKEQLYLVGDSTMQDYNENETPQRGWGQMLPAFFDTSRVEIHNHAIGGRSTKSFRNEGRWEEITSQLKDGDYVMIQFGHNDASVNRPERYTPPDDYKDYLIDFVSECREKGATPILVTPLVMRRFDEDGAFNDGHGEYPDKMREVAREHEVLLIDMHRKSMQAVSELGPKASKAYYMNLEPGEYSIYPDGLDDNTHTRRAGALKMAEIAVEGIKQADIKPLADALKIETLN